MRGVDEVARIVDRMTRAAEGPAWHGPCLREILARLDARAAAARPVVGAHSAWELVLHLAGTQEPPRRRVRGDATPLTPLLARAAGAGPT
jgi:hypothetical protein